MKIDYKCNVVDGGSGAAGRIGFWHLPCVCTCSHTTPRQSDAGACTTNKNTMQNVEMKFKVHIVVVDIVNIRHGQINAVHMQ